MSTLDEYINSQENLIQEASEALPHQFSQCTYSLGYIRQAIYLCLTCPEARGLCSACSVACHTDHNQIELFPKRNFRCDCPTSAVSHPCGLHKIQEHENESNHYGQNFKAVFCRCGRPYDATTERETMLQCLACEDWFHESCCNLRERPSSREPSPERSQEPADVVETDAESEASSSGLPPPLISAAEYDAFVCSSCVASIPILKRWTGTPGILIVIRDNHSAPWRVLTSLSDVPKSVDVVDPQNTPAVGTKRSRSGSPVDGPESKRMRASSPVTDRSSKTSPCFAPSPNAIAQRALEDPHLSSGDLFLTEGFRERWCRCDSCLPLLQAYPFLLEEEETYEHPEDPDSGLSLEELGMRALARLPRDRAIDGIHAFNSLRDNLMQYLRPFAQEGKVVREADIQSFFDTLKDSQKGGDAYAPH